MQGRRHILTGLVLGVWLLVSCSPALAQVAVYSADSKILATTALKDGGVTLWNVADGKQRQVLDGPLMHLPSMSFSPDNSLLAAWCSYTTVAGKAGKGTVRVWDTTTAKQLFESEFDAKMVRIGRVVLSPDRQSIAMVSDQGSVVLVPSIDKAQTSATLQLAREDRPSFASFAKVSVKYSPDGKILATRASDGTVKLWNVPNGQERGVLAGLAKIEKYPATWEPRLAFVPDGKSLLSQAAGPGCEDCVSLWDVAAATETLSAKSLQVVSLHDLTYSPDGKSQALFVVTDKGPTIIVRDSATDKQRFVTAVAEDPKSFFVKLEFSSDGNRLLVSFKSSQREAFAKVWDLAAGKLLATVDGVRPKLTSDGNGVVLYRAGGVKVYDFSKDVIRFAILERGMVIAPDGQTFFSVSDKGTMTLWDTARSQKRSTLAALKG